jgi:DNA modification methylase
LNKILLGDNIETLKTLPAAAVDCCITSPPYYGLRDYGVDGQIGLEESPEEYIEKLVNVFREVRRVLSDEGTLWVNIGDCYSGSGKGGQSHYIKSENWHPTYPHIGTTARKNAVTKFAGEPRCPQGIKNKDLIGIPWLLAFALRADGWYLRQDIIWNKPNPMPESVTDRCTKAHEYIFLLSKSANYYFDNNAIKEPATSTDNSIRDRDSTRLNNVPGRDKMGGLCKNDYIDRNKRDVWTVTTKPYKDAHFAVFPEALICPCVLAGSKEGGIVLDPFMGSGTTAVVAVKLLRKYVGCEINPEYIKIAEKRISEENGFEFGGGGGCPY